MGETVRLGIVTTHPIQYQAPLFRELASRPGLDLTVFFNRLPDAEQQGEGFGTSFSWDLPLLEGYEWKVLASEKKQRREHQPPAFASFAQAYSAVDVMLVHGWQSRYMRKAWWHGLWQEVPLLVRGDSNAMRPRPWYVRLLHDSYLRAFEYCLYVGESNKQFYLGAGVDEEKLRPAPHCVENERFDDDWQKLKRHRRALRSQFGITSEGGCFLFCGKFVDKKRPQDVRDAFLRAQARTDAPSHLLMVGDGALREETERGVPKEAPVTFTGFLNQTQIGEAYAAADVLALPSNYGETWGLVVNEGMMFELPAIVSDRVGCGPDLIREGETGYTFPFADVSALADRMVRMAEQPERVREMGKKARALVQKEYSISRAADGIEEATRNAHRRT